MQNDTSRTDQFPAGTEKATLAAGCFWGVEATFRKLPGVLGTSVGYCGGSTQNADYKSVCSGSTGHAEALEVVFDPKQISYEHLLEIFFANHNPTTLNRQGPDVGTQYRSAIFYHSPDQQQKAERAKEEAQLSGRWQKPVVTQIVPAAPFWRAEEYHQQYLEKRGMASCHV